ncbi:cell cycle checkpoint control protein rad9b-like [Phytophthora cinnamomi]|uniref:cell cycle checkpoint control protein rad9b-like n=1 Tax=Phytophthora cinnamomi TaxID=4785 RepID=UPI00355A430B|nr:cell cycle checkpoint control protein rad9b-like [Phytophthora cinnamomi]
MEVRLDIAEEALKVLVAALQCLSQVGKELSIECDPCARRLTLRALNDAHSASGQVVLDRSFFSEAQGGRSVTLADVDIASSETLRARFGGRTPFLKCKVFARSCCNVFRTLKHVQSVQLALLVDKEALAQADAASQDASQASDVDEVDLDCMELTWRLRCDFDITKTHHMKVQACQIMRAVFDKSASPSRWRTRQHHLSSLLTHIHHSGEVSVTCSPSHVKFESYFSNFTDSKAQLQTETAVESAEFSEYILQQPADDSVDTAAQLVFCIKEIRALLAFCKTSDVLEVSFYFSTAGSPVLFAAESTSMAKFSIEMTLSTVTTFLPASSQTRSEEEVALFANGSGSGYVASSQPPSQSQSSSQDNPRYLTHSKRPRVD